MASGTITVFGATGKSGGAAARALLAAGWTVRAVTRDAQSPAAAALSQLGATATEADLSENRGLVAAIEGADAVYFVGASLLDRWDSRQALEGMHILNAAREVATPHFIYQSALIGKARGVLGNGAKRAIEERLAELELPSTITRPAAFMENILSNFPLSRQGDQLILAMPMLPDVERGLVSIEDIGRAAVAIASDPSAHIGKEYGLIAETLSLSQMGQTLQEVTGLGTKVAAIPIEALEAAWPQGVSLFRWLAGRSESGDDTAALGQLVGEVTTFRQWVIDNEAKLVPALA